MNELASQIFPRIERIRDLRISIVPEGIRVRGTYQQLFGIRFQTLWQVFVSQGKVVARLAELKAGSLSLNFLKTYLLDTIAAAATVLEHRDETLLFDVNALLQDKGWPVRTNLTSIRCDYGSLTVESS
jgi:hypothetical protein